MCLWTVDIDTKSLNAWSIWKVVGVKQAVTTLVKYKNETEKNSAIMFISKQLYSMKKDARIMWEPEFLLLWILLWQHTKDMANFAILPQPVHLCSWKHECFLDTNILSLQSFIDHIRSIWNYYYEIILDLYTIFIWIKTQYFQLIIFNGFTTCRWVNKL